MKELFNCDWQNNLRTANVAMEELVMLADSMLTEEERRKLLEISRRLEKELAPYAGGVKFKVRHFMFPTLWKCSE